MSNPPGWRPDQRSPPPQSLHDTEGWRRYVAVTLEHILVRLHYIEQNHNHDREQSRRASAAPTSSPPKERESTWAERRDFAKELGPLIKDFRTGLMWIAVILLIAGLIAKRIDLTQLQTLKPWLGTPG